MITSARDLATATPAERLDFFGDLQVEANHIAVSYQQPEVGELLGRMLCLIEAQAEELSMLRAAVLAASFEGGMEPAGLLPDFFRGHRLDRSA